MTNIRTLPAVQGNSLAPWWQDPKQLRLVRHTAFRACNDIEFDEAVAVARDLNLSPLRKQLYAFVFSADDPKKRNMVLVVGIDGARAIAARTGNYRPDNRPPEWLIDEAAKDPLTNPHGIVSCTVGAMHRPTRSDPFERIVHTVFWDEYAPIIRSGGDDDDYEWVETGEFWPDSGKPKKKKRLRQGAEIVMRLDPKKDAWIKSGRNQIAKCFDGETEVLTASGFQRFADVNAPILQVTPAGLDPVEAVPFVQDYAGAMVTLDSDDLNFCVTPNHDMLTTLGKVEAGAIYAVSRSKAVFHIPRLAPGRAIEAEVSDGAIQLAAAYLADGHDRSESSFAIEVSRARKIETLDGLGLHLSRKQITCAGSRAHTAARVVTTWADKIGYVYSFEACAGLAMPGKRIDRELLLSLSRRQARLFVDAWLFFDGTKIKGTGVRRFYSSNEEHAGAFEVAAALAGYTTSPRRARTSDISDRPNFVITLSDRDAIPIIRWGQPHGKLSNGNAAGRTGLEMTLNVTGQVWCVTVPSGVIIVRRHGFAMLCGNCAEMGALRKGWPEDLSRVYAEEETHRAAATIDADYVDLTPSEMAQEAEKQDRLARIGGPSILVAWKPGDPLEGVPVGQFADRAMAFIKDASPPELFAWRETNREALRLFWGHSAGDALAVSKAIEARLESYHPVPAGAGAAL